MSLHLSFHSIIMLAYTIPGIYLYLRIHQLFIDRHFDTWYTIIYILVAMVFPVSNLLPVKNADLQYLKVISNYLLPFFLYLFLSVLVFDILFLLNLLFKVIPLARLKSSRVRKICLTSILLLSVAIVIGGVINFNTIRISGYKIDIPGKSSRIRHLRIAFAADFHLQERSGVGFVERFAGKIREIKPDIMIFGGDIIEDGDNGGDIQSFESILGGIHTKYGVYGVLGNHEYYSGQDRGNFSDKAGIKVLCDEVNVIECAFSIAGRDDSHFRGRKPVFELLSSSPDSLPLILVDHRPTELDQVSLSKADIQLSGHTHNGQLFPINLITRKVYELSWGHIKKGNTDFFVTSGIRLWGPPVRTTGKSEIMVIDVDFITYP